MTLHTDRDAPNVFAGSAAGQAARLLEQVRPADAVLTARCELAGEFLTDIRRLDAQLRDTHKKLAAAVKASGTSLTGIFGIGPVIAGTVIGDVRQVFRFGSRDHFAAYNGTAPTEVSSGGRQVYRLSLRGNRRVNHAIHMARSPRSGISTARAYYEKKISEGKTHKEALRSLKQRISDAIYAALAADARQAAAACPEGPLGQPGNPSVSRAASSHPHTGSSDKPLPGLPPRYGPAPQAPPRFSWTGRFAAGLGTPQPLPRNPTQLLDTDSKEDSFCILLRSEAGRLRCPRSDTMESVLATVTDRSSNRRRFRSSGAECGMGGPDLTSHSHFSRSLSQLRWSAGRALAECGSSDVQRGQKVNAALFIASSTGSGARRRVAIRRLSSFFAAMTVLALLAFEITITPAVASGVGKVTNYSGVGISGPPWIAVGPHKRNLWFTNQTTNSIGRITTTGHITNYTGTGIRGPDGIAAGSDGALWFCNERNNSIGRITITGHVANYTGTGISGPDEIAAGPDGALWFSNVATSAIGRITTVGQITLYTGSGINQPKGLTTGPDGAVWFTNEGSASIGRIDEAGNVTTFTGPGIDIPFGIVDGPDGALWFTNHGNSSIGRITTTGQVTNYTGSGVSSPDGIAVGPDGALWFTNHGNASIGRITTSGRITNYTGTGISGPDGIVAGPDGAMWFTNQSNSSIGRITTTVTPQISGFTPTSGAPGTTVTISGINLSKASKVTFAGTTATISSDTATTIVAAVPTGARSGYISVTTPAGTTTSSQTFTVT